jgi:hypothetical protein
LVEKGAKEKEWELSKEIHRELEGRVGAAYSKAGK